jgi:hypothetical protein
MRRGLLLSLIPLTAALVVIFVGVGQSAEPGTERAAREDAERRLDAFTPPPGAVRVDDLPSDLRLGGAGDEVASPNFFYVGRLWTVDKPVAWVRAWLEGAAPPGSNFRGTGQSGGRGESTLFDYEYAYRDLRGVAEERTLDASVVAYRGGSAIRAAAKGVWVEARPGSERIPDGVRVIELEREALRGGYLPRGTDRVERELIRDPAEIASLVAAVNGFELVQPASILCPLEAPGHRLRVRFLAAVGEPPLAVAALDSPFGPCSVFSLTIEGAEQRPLSEGWVFHKRLMPALSELTPP